MTKEFWITNSRLKFIVAILLLIFFTLMALIYLKADEVTRDPCSICAERYKDPIVCYSSGSPTVYRHFEVNGEVYDSYAP